MRSPEPRGPQLAGRINSAAPLNQACAARKTTVITFYILTLNEWALNDDQRLLKGRAASIVVGAMEMYNNELELRNLGLQRQILTHAAFATDSQL